MSRQCVQCLSVQGTTQRLAVIPGILDRSETHALLVPFAARENNVIGLRQPDGVQQCRTAIRDTPEIHAFHT